jgi:tetratricopeptide (TPR) repeat protein
VAPAPPPLPWLRGGRARPPQGREAEGKADVELAHLLPLADGAKRHALMLLLAERGLTDDARRERDLIRRTATPGSWELTDATRRAGDDANARGDWAAAVDLWERAFLDNMSPLTGFVEPWANVAMPALIARTRALALLDAGDVAGAMRQAEISMNSFPAEADDLFARWAKRYRDVLADFPESGSAHNMLAWAQAKCHRDLDDALAHAKRAAELEPANTACIDTLAVTYFERGEVARAVEAMRRCVELEPTDKRHREQLERFEKALAGYDKKQ